MLTKSDLTKIGQIFDERLEEKLESKLEKKLESKFEKFEVKLEEKLESKFNEKLKPIKRDLSKIRKDLEFVVGVLDKDRWKLEQKFDSHISHPPRAFATV